MFPKIRNIETSFQHIRLFSFVVVGGSMLTASFSCWYSFRLVARMQEIYDGLRSILPAKAAEELRAEQHAWLQRRAPDPLPEGAVYALQSRIAALQARCW